VDELFDAFAAGELPPEFSAFALHPDADVEEWTAGTFEGSEFGQGMIVRGRGREFELETVRQFLDAKDGIAQNFAEFLLPFAPFWVRAVRSQ